MLSWLVYAWLAAPVQPAPPALPAPSTSTPSSNPNDAAPATQPAQAREQPRAPAPLPQPGANSQPRPRTHSWTPPQELTPVAFPLERRDRSAPTPDGQRRRAPVVDLRDPFVTGGHSRPIPKHLRARLLPDLRDPFVAPRHPRPAGWKVALPGDIRDPFTERNMRPLLTDCNGVPQSTADGVSIQRPGQGREDGAPRPPETCRRSARAMPSDLQDPFRAR
jgi:hypothetical protein